jgi:hypothetical protein
MSYEEIIKYHQRNKIPFYHQNVIKHLNKFGIQKELSGDGLKDYVKNGYNFIRNFVSGPRNGPSPQVRVFLEKYGDHTIVALRVARKPIFGVIDKIANLISLGRWNRQKNKLNYDDVFHLYMVMRLSDGSIIRIDKNQVVVIAPELFEAPTAETMDVNLNNNVISLKQLITRGEQSVGLSNYWVYNPTTNNCQKFVIDTLNANNLLTSDLQKFILQDAKLLIEKSNPIMGPIATGVTNVAARFDHGMYGGKINKKNC